MEAIKPEPRGRHLTLITPSDLDTISMAAAANSFLLKRIDVCYTPDSYLTFHHRLADIKYQIGCGYVPVRASASWLLVGGVLPHIHQAAIASPSRRLVAPEGWKIDNQLLPCYSFEQHESMQILSPLSTVFSIILLRPNELTDSDMRGLACLIDAGLVTTRDVESGIREFSRQDRVRAKAIWNNYIQHMDGLLINRKKNHDRVIAQLMDIAASRNAANRSSKIQILQAELGAASSKYKNHSRMNDKLINYLKTALKECGILKSSLEQARLKRAMICLQGQEKAVQQMKIAEGIRFKILLAEECGYTSFLESHNVQDVEEIIKVLMEKHNKLSDEIDKNLRNLAEAHENSDCKCVDPYDIRNLMVDRIIAGPAYLM